MTRPRQAKTENVTTQISRVEIVGNKVIKRALALPPTSSSTKNDGQMVTISNMRRDINDEMTILTAEESKMINDDANEVNLELPELGLGETA